MRRSSRSRPSIRRFAGATFDTGWLDEDGVDHHVLERRRRQPDARRAGDARAGGVRRPRRRRLHHHLHRAVRPARPARHVHLARRRRARCQGQAEEIPTYTVDHAAHRGPIDLPDPRHGAGDRRSTRRCRSRTSSTSWHRCSMQRSTAIPRRTQRRPIRRGVASA